MSSTHVHDLEKADVAHISIPGESNHEARHHTNLGADCEYHDICGGG